MSNILWKSFNLCFSKFKCLPTITFSPPLTNQQREDEEEYYYYEYDKKLPVPTTNTSPIITSNFNSLYDLNSSDNSTFKSLTFSSTTTTTATAAAVDDFFSSSDDSDTDSILPLFTSAAVASHRFFFSSPGTSNSIFEPQQHPQDSGEAITGSVAVQTYSPDPYADFRKSMQEMIEAHEFTDIKSNWEFLHELLVCYLTLNPKQTHKFIIDAFTDVTVSLVSPPDGSRQNTHHHQHCATLPPPRPV